MAKIGRQGDGGGRPKIVFDDKQIKQVQKLARVLNKKQIADFFGIGSTTLELIEKRQPEVYVAYQKGRAMAIESVASSLIQQALDGNDRAAMFYLKTQAGWKERDAIEAQLNIVSTNIVPIDIDLDD